MMLTCAQNSWHTCDHVRPQRAALSLDSAALRTAGYTFLNCSSNCFYMSEAPVILGASCAPNIVIGGTVLDAGLPALRGVSYQLWCDPASQFCPDANSVARNMRMPLRALAQVAWGRPR